MTQHRRALAGALITVPLVLTVAACGEPSTGSSTSSDATGSPVVSGSAPASASPSSTVDASISAVIGSWAAQYGVARNSVLTAMSDLGAAAGGGGDVKAAATALAAAATSASSLPPCPDPSTETAYRTAVTQLTKDAQAVASTGDRAGAATLADKAGTVFGQTESSLGAAYG